MFKKTLIALSIFSLTFQSALAAVPNPVLVDEITDNGYLNESIESVSINSNHIFLTGKTLNLALHSILIGDKNTLETVAVISGSGQSTFSIHATDTHLYTASRDEFRIYDITDLQNITQVARIDNNDAGYAQINGFNEDLVLNGNTLFLANTDSITLVDVTNPAAPVLLSVIQNGVGGVANLSSIQEIAVEGNTLVAISDDTISAFDITNLAAPSLESQITDNQDANFNSMAGISHLLLNNNHVYVSSALEDAITIADFSVINAPIFVDKATILDPIPNLDGPTAMAISGSRLYVLNRESENFMSLDITNPAAPSFNGVVDQSTNGNDGFEHLDNSFFDQKIVQDGNNLYLHNTSNAVTKIDISNPNDFTFAQQITETIDPVDQIEEAFAAEITEDYLHIASVENGYTIFNISNLASPTLISQMNLGFNGEDFLSDLAVGDNYTFLSGLPDNGFKIFDHSNPNAVADTGFDIENGVTPGVNNMNRVREIAYNNDRIYVTACNSHTLNIFDFSNKAAAPTLLFEVTEGVGGVTNFNCPSDLEIQGDYAYVISEVDSSFTILDITQNPPTIVGQITDLDAGFEDISEPRALVIQDNKAFILSDLDETITVVNITNKANPTLTGKITENIAGAVTYNINFHDGYIYLSTDGTLYIYDPNTFAEVATFATESLFAIGKENYIYTSDIQSQTFQTLKIGEPVIVNNQNNNNNNNTGGGGGASLAVLAAASQNLQQQNNAPQAIQEPEFIKPQEAIQEPIFPPMPVDTISFSDVKEDDWFTPYVKTMLTFFIIEGYEDNTFRPAQAVTRAEFLKMAISSHNAIAGIAINLPLSVEEKPFEDVETSTWYANYIQAAKDLEVVSGHPNGNFGPNDPITRAEALKILSQITKKTLPENTESTFPDVKTSDWFAPYVQLGKNNLWVQGYPDGTFKPNNNITRAEAAKIITEAIGL